MARIVSRSRKMRSTLTGSVRIRIVVASSRRRAYDSKKLGRKEPIPLDDKRQVDKFRELARELECDDDEAAFDERLRKIATVPKPPREKPDA